MRKNKKQCCPKCGQRWNWSSYRYMEYHVRGKVYIVCKKCGHEFLAYERD